MQITRNNHQRYMARLTPLLVALYLIQIYLYQKYAPTHLSSDMNVFLGIGLAMIILLYHFYDIHHKVTLKPNYIEARFDLLKIREEMLYQNVVHVEIKKSRFHYAQVTLHGHDGEMIRLHHVDSPDLIADYIQKKKTKRN